MVIELSGVTFVLKSYAWFENQMSMQFDLKSQVWFQAKIAWHEVQLLLYYIYFEIAQFNSLSIKKYKILDCTIIYITSSWFVEKRNQKCIYISFEKHGKVTIINNTDSKHSSSHRFRGHNLQPLATDLRTQLAISFFPSEPFCSLLNPFWNHWLSLQSDWLSAMRFIHKSHYFLLLIVSFSQPMRIRW